MLAAQQGPHGWTNHHVTGGGQLAQALKMRWVARRTDQALYHAKEAGNQVVVAP